MEEHRLVRCGGIGEQRGGAGGRIALTAADQLAGRVGPQEMGGIQLAAADLAAQAGSQLAFGALGIFAGHQGRDIGVAAQGQDRVLHPARRVITAGGVLADGAGKTGQAMAGAMLLHQPQPGLFDELEQARRRGGMRAGIGLETGFPHGGAQQIMEIRTSRGGGIFQRGDDGIGVDRCPDLHRGNIAFYG